MPQVSNVIGSVAAHLALEALEEATQETALSAAIRISGFSASEVPTIVSGLADKRLRADSDEIKVIVGRETGLEGVPPKYLLEEGRTLTYYRDNHMKPAGLVMIQLEEQSDQQGLEQM